MTAATTAATTAAAAAAAATAPERELALPCCGLQEPEALTWENSDNGNAYAVFNFFLNKKK